MKNRSLRIVAWNCCGGFGRKHSVLQALKPDIAAVSEVSSNFANSFAPEVCSSLWIGNKSANRGLGVVGLNGWTLLPADVVIDANLFMACIANRGTQTLQLVAACVKKTTNYVSPTLAALDNLTGFINSAPTIMAGDFNGSVAFERAVPFSKVLGKLDSLNMRSAWHHLHGEHFGQETEATFFMHSSEAPQKQFHIDYVFAHKKFDIIGAEIGSYQDYPGRKLSDHAPLIVDLRLEYPSD